MKILSTGDPNRQQFAKTLEEWYDIDFVCGSRGYDLSQWIGRKMMIDELEEYDTFINMPMIENFLQIILLSDVWGKWAKSTNPRHIINVFDLKEYTENDFYSTGKNALKDYSVKLGKKPWAIKVSYLELGEGVSDETAIEALNWILDQPHHIRTPELSIYEY